MIPESPFEQIVPMENPCLAGRASALQINTDGLPTRIPPGAHHVAYNRNRRSAITFPDFGKLRLGIVEQIVEHLDA